MAAWGAWGFGVGPAAPVCCGGSVRAVLLVGAVTTPMRCIAAGRGCLKGPAADRTRVTRVALAQKRPLARTGRGGRWSTAGCRVLAPLLHRDEQNSRAHDPQWRGRSSAWRLNVSPPCCAGYELQLTTRATARSSENSSPTLEARVRRREPRGGGRGANGGVYESDADARLSPLGRAPHDSQAPSCWVQAREGGKPSADS